MGKDPRLTFPVQRDLGFIFSRFHPLADGEIGSMMMRVEHFLSKKIHVLIHRVNNNQVPRLEPHI